MASCPPFCVFVNPVGVTSKLASILPFSLNRANIITDIPHLSQWHWILCRITIDVDYTINGDFPIHHSYFVDKSQVLPPQRITPGTTKFSLEKTDEDLEITTTFTLDFCDVFADENFVNAYHRNNKDYQNDILLPPETQVGLFFNFVERADNGDFTLTTIKNFCSETQLHSFSTTFIDHPLTFYLSTEFPEDIEGRIDNIRINHEFFEIGSPLKNIA